MQQWDFKLKTPICFHSLNTELFYTKTPHIFPIPLPNWAIFAASEVLGGELQIFFELQEHRNTIFAASEVLGGELQIFFELQEHRNTIFAASEVLGGELQMFFELQEHKTQFFAALEVLGGELQKFFELQEQRKTLLRKIPEIVHPWFLLQIFRPWGC